MVKSLVDYYKGMWICGRSVFKTYEHYFFLWDPWHIVIYQWHMLYSLIILFSYVVIFQVLAHTFSYFLQNFQYYKWFESVIVITLIFIMPGEHTFYSGSKALAGWADMFMLRIDQVNFVFAQYLSLLLAFLYATHLPAGQTPRNIRLLVPLVFGLMILLFTVGTSTKHILGDVFICYVLMLYAPVKYVHLFVFCAAMMYLSFIHWHKIYYAQTYIIDVTGPMMILTQRLTSIACSYHDSCREPSKVPPILQQEIVRKRPSMLELMSYALSFQGVLCGPWYSYSDYICFIDGLPYWQKGIGCNNNNSTVRTTDSGKGLCKDGVVVTGPDSKPAAVKKCVMATVFLVIAAWIQPLVPVEYALGRFDLLTKLLYIFLALFLLRTQYYYAWTMADAVLNASGFGYNGEDAVTGEPKFDRAISVDIWKFELSEDWRSSLSAWNCGTMQWLRTMVYERMPPAYRTFGTFTLSAWWHGFYPGYYLTFFTGTMFTLMYRTVHKMIRPLAVVSSLGATLYFWALFIATRITIAYVAFPFALLHWGPSWQMYCELHFFMHFLALAVTFLIPRMLKRQFRVENENDSKVQ